MKDTKISWCDHTFNPWIGCTKVNEACKFCYAESHDNRFYKESHWGAGSNRLITSKKYWNQPINWNRAAGNAGIKLRVFCASLSDIFEEHPQVEDARAELFNLIEKTPNLIWMLLTKRPENIIRFIPWNWHPKMGGSVPENVRFGVSIGMQKHMDEMWPVMEQTMYELNAPYFLSMEPLLGPVDFAAFDESVMVEGKPMGRTRHLPSYVIVGGESGPKARPMHASWVEGIRNMCLLYDIKFHFKQWGEWQDGSDGLSRHNAIVLSDGSYYMNSDRGFKEIRRKYTNAEWGKLQPRAVCKVGKERSGDLLDGRQLKDLID
jgi:protein gp37